MPKHRHAAPNRVAPSLLISSCLSVLSAIPAVADAAPTETSAPAPTSIKRSYQIPAGSLADTLNQFASQAGVALVFEPSEVAALRSTGLHGSYTVSEGFAKLLGEHRLEAIKGNSGSYSLRATRSAMLPEVVVQAGAEQETASTPIHGYVAKRVTTATKTDASILETPQAISVITRDEMDMRNVQRDGDALRYTSGVISENYGADIRQGYDIGTIRGFDPTTTGMYRDGLKETNGQWARTSTDLVTTERIEVLKGPSSVLYGQSEPAGVINRVSKKPTEIPVRQLEVQVGNYDRYQGSFDLGGPVNGDGTVLYRAVGLVRDSGSQFKYDDNHSAKDDREVFAPSLTLKPSDRTTLTLQADYLHAKSGVPFTAGTATKATHTMLGDYTYDKNERRQINYGYLFEHAFNDNVTVRQNLRVSNTDFEYRRMGQAAMVGNLIARSRSIIDEKLDGISLDNQAQFKFNSGSVKHTALVGIDFQRSDYINRQGDAAPATANDLLDPSNPVYGRSFSTPAFTSENTQKIRQTGLYVQDQIKFDDHWVATLSGRRDWVEIDTENKVASTSYNQKDNASTYRVGLAYVFDNGFAPYVTYAESFNPAIGISAKGSALKPTTGKLYEAGLRYIPTGSRSSYTLSVYELTQDNVVTYDPVAFQALQVGQIRSRGVEFEAKTPLLTNLNLITALTIQNVEVTETGNNIGLGGKGASPVYVPEKSASIWLDYRFSSGWGIGGGVRYVGPSNGGDPWGTGTPDGFRYTNSSYTAFDAVLNYKYSKNWRFALNVNNLFDKEYQICGWSGCTLGYQRTAIATATYNF